MTHPHSSVLQQAQREVGEVLALGVGRVEGVAGRGARLAQQRGLPPSLDVAAEPGATERVVAGAHIRIQLFEGRKAAGRGVGGRPAAQPGGGMLMPIWATLHAIAMHHTGAKASPRSAAAPDTDCNSTQPRKGELRRPPSSCPTHAPSPPL